MTLLLRLYLDQFLLFTLLLARVSGLFVTAPIFGTRDIPVAVRGMLAFWTALVCLPIQPGIAGRPPGNVIEYAVLVGGEVLIGLMLGLGVAILIQGLQVAGRLISQVSGMAIADVLSPTSDESVPIHAHLLELVTLAVFVGVGGHRQLLAALLETFRNVPPGTAGLPLNAGPTLLNLLATSFELGLRAAAPVLVALLLATLVMGFISRTLPQLNILAVGFGLNALLTAAVLSASLGAIVLVFQDEVGPALDLLVESVARPP